LEVEVRENLKKIRAQRPCESPRQNCTAFCLYTVERRFVTICAMNLNRLLTGPIFLIGFYLFSASPLEGQEPSNCSGPFTVVFSDGSSACASSSDTVGLQPNQTVTVVAQYPASSIGHQITAVALDGGRIIGPVSQSVDDPSATVQFQFQADADPGTYQVSLRDGSEEVAVSFWVLDATTPVNNPVVVNQ